MGPYLQSETVAERALFLFFLVDATDLNTPETGESGGQPQIRKPGATTWSNTSDTLHHVGNGHYYIVLTYSELDTIGFFSIRYKSANTAEFQWWGKVEASSGEVSIDEVRQEIDRLKVRLRAIESILRIVDKNVKPPPFMDPLNA